MHGKNRCKPVCKGTDSLREGKRLEMTLLSNFHGERQSEVLESCGHRDRWTLNSDSQTLETVRSRLLI